VENIDDQIQRLLHDDKLINWVLQPDEETIAYWEQWMKDNPDGVPALFRARGIVHDLAYAQHPDEAQQLADSIWSGIETTVGEESTPAIPLSHPRRTRTAYWLAASFTGLLLLSGGLAFFRSADRSPQPEQKVANLLVRQDLDRVNQTDRSQVVYLVDGSKVTLQPGSGIRYAAFLQKDKREVYLQGNAFFEIAKDAHRPFYVYSGDLVVHVLGTSFTVNANNVSGEIMILVRTGRIAVSSRHPATAQPPVILSQDQKLVYKKQHMDWAPVTVNSQDNTAEGSPAGKAISFNFDETPVASIFQTLENAYGIPIHYDEKAFSKSIVTTSLSDETFEEKLKIICAAIGATYQIGEEGVSVEAIPRP